MSASYQHLKVRKTRAYTILACMQYSLSALMFSIDMPTATDAVSFNGDTQGEEERLTQQVHTHTHSYTHTSQL